MEKVGTGVLSCFLSLLKVLAWPLCQACTNEHLTLITLQPEEVLTASGATCLSWSQDMWPEAELDDVRCFLRAQFLAGLYIPDPSLLDSRGNVLGL